MTYMVRIYLAQYNVDKNDGIGKPEMSKLVSKIVNTVRDSRHFRPAWAEYDN